MRQLVSVGLAKTGRSMALGRNTGGRQKGSKNKPKLPLRQLAAERSEPKARLRAAAKAEAKAAEAAAKFEMAVETEQALKMPLDVMLEFMRDETNPPGFRGEMAKAAAVYCHSKAPDAQPDRVVHITELAGQGLDRRSDAKLAADKKASHSPQSEFDRKWGVKPWCFDGSIDRVTGAMFYSKALGSETRPASWYNYDLLCKPARRMF